MPLVTDAQEERRNAEVKRQKAEVWKKEATEGGLDFRQGRSQFDGFMAE